MRKLAALVAVVLSLFGAAGAGAAVHGHQGDSQSGHGHSLADGH
jgi:hypothetical protein